MHRKEIMNQTYHPMPEISESAKVANAPTSLDVPVMDREAPARRSGNSSRILRDLGADAPTKSF